MGLWWKEVDSDHFADDAPSCVFKGISWLPPKWKWPLVWRFIAPWAVIEVPNGKAYYVYFRSGNHAMRYKKPLIAGRVAVRILDEKVSFFFQSVTGDWLSAKIAKGNDVGDLLSQKDVEIYWPLAKLT